MNAGDIFLVILVSLCLFAFFLFSWTIYQYQKISKDEFKQYIIGLCVYIITILCFLLQYILLAPASFLVNAILGYIVYVAPLLAMYFFIKGTENLAYKFGSSQKLNKKWYSRFLVIAIITAIYDSIIATVIASADEASTITDIMGILYLILNITLLVITFKLFLDYKRAFGGLFGEIISLYTKAVILFKAGGVFVVTSLQPIIFGTETFDSISNFNIVVATIGAFIVVMPFLLCFFTIAKFKKIIELQ